MSLIGPDSCRRPRPPGMLPWPRRGYRAPTWRCDGARARAIGPPGALLRPLWCARLHAVSEGRPPSSGSAHRYMVDVHHVLEAAMRLVACLTMCLMPILANAAQTSAQAPSDPQGYCVNRNADFYPYTGEPCKRGYQLGSGNCRNTNGRVVAVPREQCVAMAGTVEVPFEGGRIRPQAPKSTK